MNSRLIPVLYHRRTVVPLRNWLERLGTRTHRVPLAIIGLTILAVNMPTLLHIVTTNPVQLYADLQSGAAHQALPGYPIIDPNAGYVTFSLGHLATTDWLHGHVPWWNPYEGLGSPLAGEMQSAAFFPPVFLLQDALGFVVFHVLLELVAGYATYFLLQRLGLGRAASTAGGVAFGLCGTLAWFEHATANPVAFLPLALLGVERAREAASTSRRHGWRLLAVALGLSIVSGFPEVAYLMAFSWWSGPPCDSFTLPAGRRAMAAKLAQGGVVGVLLGAPALVAFLDYLPHADVGSHAGAFANGSLPIQSLAQTILPYGFGPIFGLQSQGSSLLTIMWSNVGGYLDATLVVCALIGLFGARCRGLRIALALWVLAAMSKTFGVATVSHLLNHLPGFHSIAFYRYSEASWELAVIVLAAFGIDDMARRSLRPVVIVGAGVVSLGAIAWAAGAGLAGHDVRQGVLAPALVHRGQCRPGRRRRRRRGERWSALVRRRRAQVEKGRPAPDRGRGGGRGGGALRRPGALGAPTRTERHGPGALPAAASRPLPPRHLGPDTAELRLVLRVGRNQRQRPARSQGVRALHREITRRQRRPVDLHRAPPSPIPPDRGRLRS